MAVPTISADPSTPVRAEIILAFEALDAALRDLNADIVRASRRCQEVRRAYERLMTLRAASVPPQPPRMDWARCALTPREWLVAGLAAEGLTNSQVAGALHVSVHTVKSQMRSVLRKLDVDSRWRLYAATLPSRR